MKLSLTLFNDKEWFVSGMLSPDTLKYFNNQIEIAKEENIDYKSRLIGQISSSLTLRDPEDRVINKVFREILNCRYEHKGGRDLAPFVQAYIDARMSEFYVRESLSDWGVTDSNITLKNTSLWVNFQRKYEYNPAHTHPALFTFVAWTKVPFTMENENNHELARKTNQKNINGALNFIYGNGGQPTPHYVTPEEGGFVFFPSSLMHVVYPFYTSDDERISISGNFHAVPVKTDSTLKV